MEVDGAEHGAASQKPSQVSFSGTNKPDDTPRSSFDRRQRNRPVEWAPRRREESVGRGGRRGMTSEARKPPAVEGSQDSEGRPTELPVN